MAPLYRPLFNFPALGSAGVSATLRRDGLDARRPDHRSGTGFDRPPTGRRGCCIPMIDKACESRFFFIRHGQTVANRDGVRSGAESDTLLTELGREQARRAGMGEQQLAGGVVCHDGHHRGTRCSRYGAEVHVVVGRGPHATRRRIQRQVHSAGARRLPRPRAALRAMAPDRLQPRRRPGADGAWGLRGCRHGAELYDPACRPRRIRTVAKTSWSPGSTVSEPQPASPDPATVLFGNGLLQVVIPAEVGSRCSGNGAWGPGREPEAPPSRWGGVEPVAADRSPRPPSRLRAGTGHFSFSRGLSGDSGRGASVRLPQSATKSSAFMTIRPINGSLKGGTTMHSVTRKGLLGNTRFRQQLVARGAAHNRLAILRQPLGIGFAGQDVRQAICRRYAEPRRRQAPQ